MRKLLRVSLISLIASTVVFLGVTVIMAFWPEKTFAVDPFPVASYDVADAALHRYSTRDGETLLSRHYPSDSADTVLFLRGITSHSAALAGSALMLQEASGAEVITLDLRGHGQSGGRPGHVDYIGQYEDDVADVITAIRAERPDGRLILAGHSMGGGIALRFAQLTDRPSVDAYLMFAPHLGTDAPTMPEQDPDTAEAAALYSRLNVPRLIGLVLLNNVGIRGLNHLDTLYFNLTDEVTHTYSFAATANSSPQDHVAALSAVDAPMLVVVGSQDEAFVAAEFEGAVAAHSDGEVHVIDGENHTGIVESPVAMTIVADWMSYEED